MIKIRRYKVWVKGYDQWNYYCDTLAEAESKRYEYLTDKNLSFFLRLQNTRVVVSDMDSCLEINEIVIGQYGGDLMPTNSLISPNIFEAIAVARSGFNALYGYKPENMYLTQFAFECWFLPKREVRDWLKYVNLSSSKINIVSSLNVIYLS